MKKHTISFLLPFILFSCINFTKNIETPKYATGIENIKHNLDKKKIDLFEAYILTNKFLKKHSTDSKEYENATSYLSEIITLLNKNAKEEFDTQNYEKALAYVLSLNSIKKESSISLKNVYHKILEHADLSSDIFTQFSLREEMADRQLLTEDEVYLFLKSYAERKSKGVFLYHYNQYIKLYPNLLAKHPDLKKFKEEMENLDNLNLEKLRNSVVAVILNKGMNIKNGVGYFDKSIGTGFFIDNNGYILTNHHVIADHVDPKYEGFSEVYVTTIDEPDVEIPAKVIGFDKVFDIALLKIPKDNKEYLTLGRSGDMTIGSKIYTIGNPIGITHTVTSGIISNKNLDFFQLGKALQIDAAINPGNSGGPLIDDKGQVVGIVFAGIPQYEGINFVIPFEWVRRTIPALYKGNEVKRCWIGSGIYKEDNKVFFYYILPNGPASKAGIMKGDRLLAIDGKAVNSVEEAQDLLSWRRYPRLIEIETERKGEKISRIVNLIERPYLPIESAFEKDTEGNLISLIFGIGVEYYGKGLILKRYKTTKIYKGMYGFQLNIGEGDPIVVYDLKYLKKEKIIRMSLKFKQKELGIIDRIVTIVSPAEIDSIL